MIEAIESSIETSTEEETIEAERSYQDFPEAFEECSAYFGELDAAVGVRAQSYSSAGGQGFGKHMTDWLQFAEEPGSYDCPVDPLRHPMRRKSVQRRTLIERTLSTLPPADIATLRLVLTPRRWQWSDRRAEGKRKDNELSIVEDKIRWHFALSRPAKMEQWQKCQGATVCLLALALETKTARDLFVDHATEQQKSVQAAKTRVEEIETALLALVEQAKANRSIPEHVQDHALPETKERPSKLPIDTRDQRHRAMLRLERMAKRGDLSESQHLEAKARVVEAAARYGADAGCPTELRTAIRVARQELNRSRKIASWKNGWRPAADILERPSQADILRSLEDAQQNKRNILDRCRKEAMSLFVQALQAYDEARWDRINRTVEDERTFIRSKALARADRLQALAAADG